MQVIYRTPKNDRMPGWLPRKEELQKLHGQCVDLHGCGLNTKNLEDMNIKTTEISSGGFTG